MRDMQIIRVLATFSFGVSLALGAALARTDVSAFPIAAATALATLAAWHGVPRLRAGFARNAVLAIAVINASTVVPELALRLMGFRYEAGIQFGYPRPSTFIHLMPDPQLFWRRNPSDRGVNSLGFVGREVAVPKPAGTRRILFLGDSVTEQGFPDVVEYLLNIRHASGATRYECVTLASAGYSSYQGRVLADLYGSSLEPDAAVVLFGWNDHYFAYGAPDAGKKGAASGSTGWLTRAYHRIRLLQLARWSWDTVRRARPTPLSTPRVSPDEYRGNLIHMKERLSAREAPVIFLTSPTANYAVGVPDYLVRRDFAADRSSSIDLHRRYNAIVREVAAETGAALVDLEAELGGLGYREVAGLFSRDGIHLSAPGIAVVASRVADALAGILPPSLGPASATEAAP